MAGLTIDNQHRGRMVDVPLPLGNDAHGIYEDLRGYADGAALTDTIKARCRTVFGTPGSRFVQACFMQARKAGLQQRRSWPSVVSSTLIRLARKLPRPD